MGVGGWDEGGSEGSNYEKSGKDRNVRAAVAGRCGGRKEEAFEAGIVRGTALGSKGKRHEEARETWEEYGSRRTKKWRSEAVE
jgi:hypothetical protein